MPTSPPAPFHVSGTDLSLLLPVDTHERVALRDIRSNLDDSTSLPDDAVDRVEAIANDEAG